MTEKNETTTLYDDFLVDGGFKLGEQQENQGFLGSSREIADEEVKAIMSGSFLYFKNIVDACENIKARTRELIRRQKLVLDGVYILEE